MTITTCLSTITIYLSTITTYLSTLNINGLNAPVKRHGDWMDKKIRPSYTMSTRDLLQLERYTEAKRKDRKSYFIKMKTNKQKEKLE